MIFSSSNNLSIISLFATIVNPIYPGGHNVPPCRFFDRSILTGKALKLILAHFI